MPLGQGILGIFEAIPRRIEMSGQAPTWRITGASFDEAWAFAREVVDGDPVVVAREDRTRWWPRVTLTVTVDPELAAAAPPMKELRMPPVTIPEQPTPVTVPLWNDEEYAESFLPLEEIFASQEEVREARQSVPRQRTQPPSHRADVS